MILISNVNRIRKKMHLAENRNDLSIFYFSISYQSFECYSTFDFVFFFITMYRDI
jgi:hypothetical protein